MNKDFDLAAGYIRITDVAGGFLLPLFYLWSLIDVSLLLAARLASGSLGGPTIVPTSDFAHLIPPHSRTRIPL